MADQADKPNKSLNSLQSTGVFFENVSIHSVAVLWLNYSGDPVWYRHLLPGASYQQQTYVTHPWVCVECDTGLFALMKINKQDVLFPEAKPIHAVITTEETSLLQQCLAVVRVYLHEVQNVSLVEPLRESVVRQLPLSPQCIRQLLELDSTPPPRLAEKYVKNLKEKFTVSPQKEWNQILSRQRFSQTIK